MRHCLPAKDGSGCRMWMPWDIFPRYAHACVPRVSLNVKFDLGHLKTGKGNGSIDIVLGFLKCQEGLPPVVGTALSIARVCRK